MDPSSAFAIEFNSVDIKFNLEYTILGEVGSPEHFPVYHISLTKSPW